MGAGTLLLRPSLSVIGVVPPLRGWMGAAFFPFDLIFCDLPPRLWQPGDAALVPFPDTSACLDAWPVNFPFLGCGPAACLPEAFSRGAVDYLKDPWTLEELVHRADRIVRSGPLPVPHSSLRLEGLVLRGARGTDSLTWEEAAVLRELIRMYGFKVSRVALRRFIWPSLDEGTRVVDMTVSRLRRAIHRISAVDDETQIRSIRGFGYALTSGRILCDTCG
jgi:hypothetical protein